MNIARLITIYGSFIFILCQAKEPMKRVLIIKSLTQCSEYKDLVVEIRNVTTYPAQRNVYKIWGEFVYREPITYGQKATIDVKTCPDTTGHLENCKQFVPRITINNICEILEAEDSVLTKFTTHLQPPAKCPLYGLYKMNGIQVDADLMNYMPIGNIQSYYVTIMGEYKSKKIFCVNFYVQVRPRRS